MDLVIALVAYGRMNSFADRLNTVPSSRGNLTVRWPDDCEDLQFPQESIPSLPTSRRYASGERGLACLHGNTQTGLMLVEVVLL